MFKFLFLYGVILLGYFLAILTVGYLVGRTAQTFQSYRHQRRFKSYQRRPWRAPRVEEHKPPPSLPPSAR